MASFWKIPANLEQLKELAASGLSARQIAGEMGKTRNAILGACLRERVVLPGISRNAPQRGPGHQAGKKTKKSTPVIRANRPPPTPISEPCPPRLLDDLGAGMCRWPVSDAPVFMFCAMPEYRKGYCEWHDHKAHNRSEVKTEEVAA